MSFVNVCNVFSAFAASILLGTVFVMPDTSSMGRSTSDSATVQTMPPLSTESLREALPVGTRVDFCDSARRGWKLGGEFGLGMEASLTEVTALMRDFGYAHRHQVGGVSEKRQISEWMDPDGRKVIWSLAYADWNRTFFSWGVSE